MSTVSAKLKSSIENIEAGDYSIAKGHEGESVDVPRWMAEELSSLGLAQADDEPFEVEVLRALSREKLMGPLQLSALPQNFYVRMMRRVRRLADVAGDDGARKIELQRMKGNCYDIVGMRLSKLLALSSASTTVRDAGANMAPEEKEFFVSAQSLSKEWRGALLGEGK